MHASTPRGVHPAQPLPHGRQARRTLQLPGTPAPEAEPHLATEPHLAIELKGDEQQEGPSGGAVYSLVDGIQGLRPQEPVKYPSPPTVRKPQGWGGSSPFCAFHSHLFFTYGRKSGRSNRYLSNRKSSQEASWGLCLWAGAVIQAQCSYLAQCGPHQLRGHVTAETVPTSPTLHSCSLHGSAWVRGQGSGYLNQKRLFFTRV